MVSRKAKQYIHATIEVMDGKLDIFLTKKEFTKARRRWDEIVASTREKRKDE